MITLAAFVCGVFIGAGGLAVLLVVGVPAPKPAPPPIAASRAERRRAWRAAWKRIR